MARRVTKSIEYLLWLAGVATLAYCAYILIDARIEQARGNRNLNKILQEEEKKKKADKAAPATHGAPPYGSLVGRLDIPRLNLSTIIFEGTDEPILEKGIGHLMGSALPGNRGNVVFAAHRDTFFRALQNIKKKDLIRVTTEFETKHYVVESTEIINPSQTQVLQATATPTLTLVTCYPFYFVGHAPKRFIVRGREIPDGPAPPDAFVGEAAPDEPTIAPKPPPSKVASRSRARPKRSGYKSDSDEDDDDDDRPLRKPVRDPGPLQRIAESAPSRSAELTSTSEDAPTPRGQLKPPKQRSRWNPLRYFGKRSRTSSQPALEASSR